MSRVAPPVTCDYVDKHGAAKHLQDRGFHNITPNSITYAARTKKLHEPKRLGKTYFWRTTWLDEWAESL